MKNKVIEMNKIIKDSEKLYKESINESTNNINKNVTKLKKLYEQNKNSDIANYYAKILYDLTFKSSQKKAIEILKIIKKLYEDNSTSEIAERLARLQYNIEISENVELLEIKKYAENIEKLYINHPSEYLAEPLVKTWYKIVFFYTADKAKYIKKIIDICEKYDYTGLNEVYSKILFDKSITLSNRETLVKCFFKKKQTLFSVFDYISSCYYPKYNSLIENIYLYPDYPYENICKKINIYLDKLNKYHDSINIKLEILAIFHYTFKIKKYLILKDNTIKLGHYTKINNLKYLTDYCDKKAKLRMSNAYCMNDPTEGKRLLNLLSNCTNYNFELNDNKSLNIYISCFTAAIDQLPMWSMYGDDGKGCCLIIDNVFFDYTTEEFEDETVLQNNVNKNLNFVYRVAYITKNNKIKIDSFKGDEENLENKINDAIKCLIGHLKKLIEDDLLKTDKNIIEIICFAIDEIRFLFKDYSYSHEHEFRLIKYSEEPIVDDKLWIVPQLFVEIDKELKYKKIILGPKVEQVNRVIPYLNYTKNIKQIEASRIKYR